MPEAIEWVELYHPEQRVKHNVPNNPGVIDYFRDLGWYTPEESAAHAEEEAAAHAEALKGKALDDALAEKGLPKTGTADEKRARLAELEAESATPTEENEGEQV
jgi:hypothetical protein